MLSLALWVIVERAYKVNDEDFVALACLYYGIMPTKVYVD